MKINKRKIIDALESGYVTIQYKTYDENENEKWISIDISEYERIDHGEPFYLCVLFQNNSRLPLPWFWKFTKKNVWPYEITDKKQIQIRKTIQKYSKQNKKKYKKLRVLCTKYLNKLCIDYFTPGDATGEEKKYEDKQDL